MAPASRSLLLRVCAAVAVVVVAKVAAHSAGWEVISLNPLFSGIIAAVVFLMGFLLSGVLSDYKESERMPGELATALENLHEEMRAIAVAKPEADIAPGLAVVAGIGRDLLDWFHKRIGTPRMLERLNALTPQLAGMEKWTQAALVGRLKQEQANIRRLVVRIDTIRETSFISSGYKDAIAFVILLLILFLRPQGLFSRGESERV